MDLTQAEINHCDGLNHGRNFYDELNYAGSFKATIMTAIMRADDINLKKLSIIYPKLVKAYELCKKTA